MTIRPVKKGIEFEGELYFKDLTKAELDQLIYLLDAGEDKIKEISQKRHGYKLGGGKPLGLGSIAISVHEVLLRKIKKDPVAKTVVRTDTEPYEEYEAPALDSQILKNFRIMTDFDAVKGKNVSYPLTGKRDKDGNMNVFDWFSQNHAGYRVKDGQKIPLKMPNSRKRMAFVEYMEPMTPELKSTGYREQVLSGSHRNNGKFQGGKGRKAGKDKR